MKRFMRSTSSLELVELVTKRVRSLALVGALRPETSSKEGEVRQRPEATGE